MKLISTILLIMLMACSPLQVAEEEHSAAGSKYVLKNGMTVLIKENQNTGMVALDLIVKRGISTDGDLHGLSSLTHKSILAGTTTRTKEQITSEIENVGGEIISRTYTELSEISIQVPSTDVSIALDVLQDVLTNPTFDSEEIEKERELLIQEIKSYEDQPHIVAEEVFMKTLYEGHPYEHPPDGYVEDIEKIKREDIVNHHKQWYAANHLILAVAGNVDRNAIINAISRTFGKLEKNNIVEEVEEPEQIIEAKQASENKFLQSYFIHTGYLTVPASHPDFIKLRVAASILGLGTGSRMFYELRDKRALAYSVFGSIPSIRNRGFYKTILTVRPEVLNESLAEVEKQIELLKDEEVSDEELRDVKQKIKGLFFLDHQRSDNQANYLAIYEANGLGYEMDALYPQKIDEVTSADIKYVANSYFNNPTTAIVGPFTKGAIR